MEEVIGSIPIRSTNQLITYQVVGDFPYFHSRLSSREQATVGCNNAGMNEQDHGLDRRGFLGVCSMVGLGQTLLPGALFTLATQARAQSSPIMGSGDVKASTANMAKITPEMIEAAAVIAG